jgi:hypothetical protein
VKRGKVTCANVACIPVVGMKDMFSCTGMVSGSGCDCLTK